MKTNEEMLSALEGLLSIESVSIAGSADMPYGEGVFRAMNYTLELCSSLGFRVTNCDNKTAFAEIGSGEEIIGILVHLDVVPEGSGWSYPAFGCTRVDGRIYGRGISDDKGPAIASIFAMKDILDSGIALNKRIRIIFGMAEETGDWSDIDYYKQTQELPVCGFTPDADFPALHGEKGLSVFELTMPLGRFGLTDISGGSAANMVADSCSAVVDSKVLSTTGRSAHGSTPEEGENAISKMMEQFAGHPAADFYNACIGYDLNGQRLNIALEDSESGKLTVNVGTVRVENGSVIFSVDIRYPVSFTVERVIEGIESAVAPYGVSVRLKSHMKPVYMDKNGPVISALLSAYRETTGDIKSESAVIGGGTYARAMDNIVAFGPMLPGRELTEHQKNEYLLEDDYLLLRQIYKTALEKLLAL